MDWKYNTYPKDTLVNTMKYNMCAVVSFVCTLCILFQLGKISHNKILKMG